MFVSRMRGNMTDLDLDDLRAELDDFAKPKKEQTRSPWDERVIAGFEEIQRFVEEHGHPPRHGEDLDIFERLYAVRLDQIKRKADCRELCLELDHQNLLAGSDSPDDDPLADLEDDELLSELEGIGAEVDELRELKHVRSRTEIQAAEKIGRRKPCEDFDEFRPRFDLVVRELKEGLRKTIPFRKNAGFTKTDIKHNQFIILEGQTSYIAEIGEPQTAPNGEYDARLRIIYDNGTEGDILLRTLIRAMYRDETCRLISDPEHGPLFADYAIDGDEASGTIYVLRSKSSHPTVAQHRDIVHKIGVTNKSIEKRISRASSQPTFLMADVEVVTTYELYNINRTRLENLLHKIFHSAQLDIEIKDRFGKPVVPREWFLVPLFVIEEAVEKIKDGTITDYIYDAKQAKLLKLKDN